MHGKMVALIQLVIAPIPLAKENQNAVGSGD
jgi:hypothetical protein